ncbi:MAG: type 2 isopentenyl-diphosphate Delta-isomerase [Desulfurococcales archaeon]|nr:type 2 isopentenyl-diphosphate Delta-isomerase [Desulfurococcales archaeon]
MEQPIKIDLKDRKLDHIKICNERNVEASATTLLENVMIEHMALPENDLDDIDTRVYFLNKKINAPLMIAAMTGGHPTAAKINEELAKIAEKYTIPIGVGSQRAAIEHPRLAWTFKVVRENAPSVPVIANLGAPQFSRGYSVKEAEEAVQMIEADALAVHLNPLQEAFQLEGDNWYKDVLVKIKELNDSLPVPVILKETGTGISYTVARTSYNLGIKYFDVSGLGGTNWGKVEAIRATLKGIKEAPMRINGFGDFWGIPTAFSILSTRIAAPDSTIIASGGIRNGLDIARSIALGADLAAMALPILRILLHRGRSGLESFLEQLFYQIKVAVYLSGSRNIDQLKCSPNILLSGELLGLLKQLLHQVKPDADIITSLTLIKCVNKLEVPNGWRL